MSQIVCDNLVKIYKVADLEVVALQGLDLLVEQGEFIAIVGASGSGKSTLQNILGGMDVPTAGKAEVAGFDLTSLTPKERTIYRRSIVGFVWQQTTRNLLPYLSAEENVELPLILEGMRGADRREYAVELLRLVGMAERAGHKPDQLSGGEQQEFAVLDRAGRLQLPQEYMDALELQRRVRLELEPDHIGVWPDKANREQNGD
jgi:ABC-type lipoprotein export system ATPase subunit